MKTRLSNWKEESDLYEVVTGKMTDKEALKKVDEKKGINNKVVINPKLSEAIDDIGGEVLAVNEALAPSRQELQIMKKVNRLQLRLQKEKRRTTKEAEKAQKDNEDVKVQQEEVGLSSSAQMAKARKEAELRKKEEEAVKKEKKALKKEEFEAVVEYFYAEGINEEGIDLIIEEVGLDAFVDFVDDSVELLTEEEGRPARKMNVRTLKATKKKAEEIKASKKDVVARSTPKDVLSRARTERSFKKPKLSKAASTIKKAKKDYDGDGKKETPKQEHRGVRNKKITQAVKKVKPAQPKKPASKEGIRAKVKAVYDAGVKRHRKATQPIRVFHKGMKKAPGEVATFVKKAKRALVGEKLDYDPMDDPDFDPREAEKNRGVSGKNNPKGGKKLKDLTKEEVVHEKFATQYKDKGKLSKTDAPGSRHDHTHDVDPRMADYVPKGKVRKSSKAETRANVLKFDMKKEGFSNWRDDLEEAKVDKGKSDAEKAEARNKRNTPAGKNRKFDTSVFITRKPGESLDSARTRKRREAHAAKRGVKEEVISEKDLSAAERRALPDKDFVFPGKGEGPEGKQRGAYPINDKKHARAALAMAAAHASPEKEAKVKAAVKKKYPGIKVSEAKVDTGDDVKKETDRNKRRFGKDAAPRGSGGVEYAQTLVRRREHRAKRGIKEDKALDIVRANIIKKHGKGAIYDPKRDKPTEAQKKAAAAERKKRDADKAKAFADRAKKAGYKNPQDYANVVARYGSEDNYKKGRGLD